MDKWNSRKLLLSSAITLLLVALPVLYHQVGISDSTTMLVIGCIASICGIYHAANVADKKYGSDS